MIPKHVPHMSQQMFKQCFFFNNQMFFPPCPDLASKNYVFTCFSNDFKIKTNVMAVDYTQIGNLQIILLLLYVERLCVIPYPIYYNLNSSCFFLYTMIFKHAYCCLHRISRHINVTYMIYICRKCFHAK